MNKRLLSVFFFLLSLAVVITACGGGGGGGSGSDGSTTGTTPAPQPTPTTPGSSGNGTQADSTSIPILLQQYRDEIYSTLPVDKRKDVENYASGYPVEVSGNAEPVVVQSNGTPPQLTTVINRRDWAYDEKGITYTYMGIFAVGQEKMLDLGFWCFLEAALLRPDEPEHLSNVAFHLNERGKSADARKLLLHALSFDNKNTVVLNNLAYASAALGDYGSAVTHSLVALCQDQGVSLILERLRYYAKAGGYDLIAEMAEAGLGGIGEKCRNWKRGWMKVLWGCQMTAEPSSLSFITTGHILSFEPPPFQPPKSYVQWKWNLQHSLTKCILSILGGVTGVIVPPVRASPTSCLRHTPTTWNTFH